jgi:hypothetical protein
MSDFSDIGLPVVGGIASLGSALIGSSAQSKALQASIDAYQQSVKDLEAIGVPTAEAQQLTLEQYKSSGQMTPELEQAVQQGPSNMLGVTTDPAYKASQLKALSSLQDIGDSGGMTLSDRATLERTMGNVNAKTRGAREAILQDAQQRGGYGSGTSLAAQLMAQQGGAQDAHQAGLDAAAQAQQRALQAIQGAGQMGGQLRSQDYGEQADKARAQDAIAAWNAQNRQQVGNTNVGTRNAAQQYNLTNAQNLSNANVDTRNKEQAYNKGLQQTYFQNQMDVAKAKASARAGQAQAGTQGAAQQAQLWGNIGSAVNQGVTAYAQRENENDQREKDRVAGVSTK